MNCVKKATYSDVHNSHTKSSSNVLTTKIQRTNSAYYPLSFSSGDLAKNMKCSHDVLVSYEDPPVLINLYSGSPKGFHDKQNAPTFTN